MARAMATREKYERGDGGNGKEIASGWSQRFLKLRWRREEVKPYFSLWKAIKGCLLRSDWGWQVLGSFWRGWISASRMGKKTNGRRVGRRRGEVIPWCVKPTRWVVSSG